MRCFHERGYAATRVEDIVQAAGYTRGAFYFHFVDKSDCFRHVIAHREQLRGDWPSEILADLDPATTSLEDVLRRLFVHFEQAEHGLSAWILVMVDFHQQHRDDAGAQALLAETYATWHDQVTEFVTALQQRGWVTAGANPARLARQVFAYSEGTIAHTELYRLADDDLIDGLCRLLRD